MKAKKILGLLAFDIPYIIVNIGIFVHLVGMEPELSIAGALFSAISLSAVNSRILSMKPKTKTEKVKTIRDYREALSSWGGKNNPFNSELREAVYQLDAFQQKQTSLKFLLGDDAKESTNPFMSVSHDVEECLLSNARKFLNRMMIMDPRDPSRFPMHNEYLHHLLIQNRQLLSQYDNLIIEISQIGTSKDMENLHLDSITEALRELRNEDETATVGEYGAAMLMSQQGWDM